MRNTPFWFVIIGLMLVLDFYVFQAIKVVNQAASEKVRTISNIIYWVLSVSALLLFIALPYLNLDSISKGLRTVIFVMIASVFFAKILVSLFLMIDDVRRGFQWVAGKLFFYNTEGEQMQEGQTINRSVFLSWLGLVTGGGLLGSLVYGFSNKYDYRVRKVPISFSNLPQAFRGLKIVQISDVHSGSFHNKSAVQRGIEKILKLQPDLILFTGDLVNGRAEEMANYKDIFSLLKAPLGVYSILGNHDYGDYETWSSKEQKVQNLEHVKAIHSEMGWRLLLNEHVVLEKNSERMALIGVENWSAKANFPKYGRLEHAYSGAEEIPFKLLMSHDPSHWDAEVRTKYPDIDLMLAGHTHGMQFGVELPWFRWSPVQYVYRQWAGLYEEGRQKLYVNRGFGFLGYPGRVGILPEITLIELS
ncbi:metallophosphoesterase [Chitinophagaceae bacterium LB-8]|uniref:Metallophosphoesterase n=1 Tax=Paraflavisolibacter caeni TaxID=2982496 RepID=A0A9X3BK88_9BACT|nr:metallophosphoesterase [Paraflavisolibacter caeni]MCU7552428.1 metallophosphoesterase [Paraflavisolibacter caeni]